MKSLVEMIEEVEKHNVDISQWFDGFPEHIIKFAFVTNYYWGLAAYVNLMKPKRVLELGTCTGASAVIMANAGTTVVTWDLEDKWEIKDCPENVNINIGKDEDEVRSLDLSPYDMIFLDINHDGKEEIILHEKLTKEYKGIVFYDDITLNKEMFDFWQSIEQEKLPLRWHEEAGFGVVRYG